LGVLAIIISRLFGADPFTSESLDNLAQKMNVTKILRKPKQDRYYKRNPVMQGGLASFDRIFFDAKYLEMLLPDELLAVAAHEFTHLNERHGIKRFWRLLMPALVIGAITFLLFNYSWGNYITSGLTSVIVTFCGIINLFVFNTNWERQQEIECDLSSVKNGNGDAIISALMKLSSIRPRNNIDIKLAKIIPYPSLEQRINNIRKQQTASG
jgi:Zn-dependent protease with chaperone function